MGGRMANGSGDSGRDHKHTYGLAGPSIGSRHTSRKLGKANPRGRAYVSRALEAYADGFWY